MSINRPRQSKAHPLEKSCLSETGRDNEHAQENAERCPVDRRDKIRLAQHTSPNHQSSTEDRGGGFVKSVGEDQAVDSEEDPDNYDSESGRESQISRRLGPSS